MSVIARIEPRVIPTYPVGAPEKNPVFFEKRVYQGSNGKVYPVPFIDKVFDEPIDVTYQSVLLENDYIRLVILPEIGGRIFIGQDKTNNDYDFFYRQDVIKPALVGLAGPWISGGVEFNWPQHHRPGTFMPTDVYIEEEADGAKTVWLSEHDPLNRLKGMHGIRLRPGSSLIELRVRLYNRTPLIHTFLWWANVAAKVHEQYQAFFPPDVHYVADHAVRATSSFPIANNPYYGIPYQDRPGANDLSWYKNIPVPTSYMVCQTDFSFAGGYDFSQNGGFVHVANRHLSPGKKQWTWGNDAFGWAWDRELTDNGGPYVELMAGVYTDNQPDFSYLNPYETKTFSQYWWPIQNIGPVQQASSTAALACTIKKDHSIELGVCVSDKIENACLLIRHNGDIIAEHPITLSPGESWQNNSTRFLGKDPTSLVISLMASNGNELIAYQPIETSGLTRDREVASEPPTPKNIKSTDELFFTGEHLEQYRHPTRNPETYWNEALKRDPGDARCHTALGKQMLTKGVLNIAADHFEQAIARLTQRHPNPSTGEAHYYLGITQRWMGKTDAAYKALYKSTWNYEWRSCAYYQLATIDCQQCEWFSALSHLESSLDTNRQNNKAHILKAVILRHLGRGTDARVVLDQLQSIDPLDHWANHEQSLHSNNPESFLTVTRNDAQTILDLVFDYCEAGFFTDAITLLKLHQERKITPVAVPNPLERSPMILYVSAWIKTRMSDPDAAETLSLARAQPADHFFPSRLEEIIVLEWALKQPGNDPLAAYALGNYYFDKRRHQDAITVWETAVAANTDIAQIYRNLGIAYWNHMQDGEKASTSYQRALELAPDDARIISEIDQLASKRNQALDTRLAFFKKNYDLVLQRDDATIAFAAILNQTDNPQDALDLITSRRFHPWEGGEGAVLRQYTTAHILLGRHALERDDPELAHEHFAQAMNTPESLGEAYHPLQAKADVNYWIGRALKQLGNADKATDYFRQSAQESGDFSGMAVTEHSPLSYYRGLSLRELGDNLEADKLFNALLTFGKKGLKQMAQIDYFATSLPNLLVFDENLQARSDAEHNLLIALAQHGLGNNKQAHQHLQSCLDFSHDDQQAHNLSTSLNKIGWS